MVATGDSNLRPSFTHLSTAFSSLFAFSESASTTAVPPELTAAAAVLSQPVQPGSREAALLTLKPETTSLKAVETSAPPRAAHFM